VCVIHLSSHKKHHENVGRNSDEPNTFFSLFFMCLILQ